MIIVVPTRDHPRVCGEKTKNTLAKYVRKGSPPRVRGKVVPTSSAVVCWRITPACAGKSFVRTGGISSLKDHPRVCGEKQVDLDCSGVFRGSPPRVRGKDDHYV